MLHLLLQLHKLLGAAELLELLELVSQPKVLVVDVLALEPHLQTGCQGGRSLDCFSPLV